MEEKDFYLFIYIFLSTSCTFLISLLNRTPTEKENGWTSVISSEHFLMAQSQQILWPNVCCQDILLEKNDTGQGNML